MSLSSVALVGEAIAASSAAFLSCFLPATVGPRERTLSVWFVHEKEVFIRRRFLRAAVLLLLRRGIGRALATALRAVDGQIRGPLERQGAGGDLAASRSGAMTEQRRRPGARRAASDASRSWPGGGSAGMASHAWFVKDGFLKDEEKKQFVFHLWQGPVAPPPATTLARRALQGLFWRIQQSIGGGKRREQTRKFCVRQAGRREKLSWSVL